MTDREVILDVLRRVARRLWVIRVLREVGFGLSVGLFSLLAFQLVWPALAGDPVPPYSAILALAVAGSSAYALWLTVRRSTLAQAAGAADRHGRLNDELKTAYWLFTREECSGVGELQVARAARTAGRLDPRRIVPAQAPPGLWIAGILALLFSLASSLAPRLSLSRGFVPPETADTPASLRALLAGAPEDERLRRLDQVLATLERPEISVEQRQQALTQARDAVDEANLRAVAARESLSRVAATMRGREQWDTAANALEEGRTREALDILKTLASREEAPPAGGDPGASSAAQDGAVPDHSGENAGRDLRHQGARVDEDALSKVIKKIEAARDAFDAQRRANEVRRRMEDFLIATSQRSALTASQFGNGASAANPTTAPQTGEADLQGGTMYRQGAVARDGHDDSQEGGRTGAATGHSEALELEGTKTQRLDARLKLESLQVRSATDDRDEHEGQTSWYYQPTRGGEAKAAFAPPSGRERFADAQAMNPDRVTLHNRQSVKDYFIKLHESAPK